ncbi:MAG: fimbrial biogenesis outer membrane usher protein, partial [Microcystaceae cyanobacterium]
LIGVNPGLYGYVAEASAFGPAVVPDLSAYTLTTLRVDAPNMPLGFDLGKTVYTLLPSYRSGMAIIVGTEATVFLRGVLKNRQDQPIGLQAGQVGSLSDPNWEPVTLFTNKVGKFALLGLKPGRYELKLFTEPSQKVE